jgi:hypothetical protein
LISYSATQSKVLEDDSTHRAWWRNQNSVSTYRFVPCYEPRRGWRFPQAKPSTSPKLVITQFAPTRDDFDKMIACRFAFHCFRKSRLVCCLALNNPQPDGSWQWKEKTRWLCMNLNISLRAPKVRPMSIWANLFSGSESRKAKEDPELMLSTRSW